MKLPMWAVVSMLLTGIGFVSVAGYMVSPAVGIATGGAGLLLLGLLTDVDTPER